MNTSLQPPSLQPSRQLAAGIGRKNAHGSPCAILGARLRLALSGPVPGKLAFIPRLAEEDRRHQERAAWVSGQIVIFKQTVDELVMAATAKFLAENPQKKKAPQRKIAGLIGLPESTLRKCQKSPKSALANLIRLQSALSKLKPS